MHKLEIVEKSVVKQESVYHVESSSKPKGEPKGGKNNKKYGKKTTTTTKPTTMKSQKASASSVNKKVTGRRIALK